ncbi:MAG: hypothetical protein M1818_000704 [Claussenomyces sp. TS43310]|nr:MAG: hypothetical protein M1818_000704 [Claussenomyces sp. TS43310]
MSYEGAILPGGGSSPSPTSPSKVAGQMVRSLRQPKRRRGRIALASILGLMILSFLTGRRKAFDYNHYIANGLAMPNAVSRAESTTLPVDERTPVESSHSKPNFHLLIPARRSNLNLCKTLLSAAVLNYPPPTLISYGLNATGQPLEVDIKHALLNRQDDDLALLVDQNTFFQLPAEVMISRFDDELKRSDERLRETYDDSEQEHRQEGSHVKGPIPLQRRRYHQKVIFAANKPCQPHSVGSLACQDTSPASLTDEIYGAEPAVANQGPRYLAAHGVMGRVSHLVPVYDRAINKIAEEGSDGSSSQRIFSEIFAEQAAQRSLHLRKAGSTWKQFLRGLFRTQKETASIGSPNITAVSDSNLEFGMGIDYRNSIFQTMDNSITDMEFVNFEQADAAAAVPDRGGRHLRHKHFPQDLSRMSPPYAQHRGVEQQVSNLHPVPEDRKWDEVDLATNVAVPGGSVPTALRFNPVDTLLEKWWPKMWYQPHARALLHRYMRSPQTPVAAEAAAQGGDTWWDLRGGKGGVWTDQGEWLEWNEVCGEYDDAVFMDGKGVFGKEDGDSPVYNSFGKLIAHQEP